MPWYFESEVPVDENPDEVIRVRVRGHVPNNYTDEHFDLRDPDKILGKTLAYLNHEAGDSVGTSLRCLGLVMAGKGDAAKSLGQFTIVEEVLEIAQEFANDDTKEYLNSLPKENADVDDALLKKCKSCLKESEESIIENQKKLYKEWNQSRDTLLGKCNRRTSFKMLHL